MLKTMEFQAQAKCFKIFKQFLSNLLVLCKNTAWGLFYKNGINKWFSWSYIKSSDVMLAGWQAGSSPQLGKGE
jgi:hypothetical protein